MLTMLDIAYLAGFFDGEGHVGIDTRASKARAHHHPSYHLKVTISQVESDETMMILNHLRDQYGGSIYIKDNSVRNSKWRRAAEWTVVARGAARFLQDIHPHVILKRAQVDVAIAFQARRLPQGQRGNTEARVAADLADKQTISDLNRGLAARQEEVASDLRLA